MSDVKPLERAWCELEAYYSRAREYEHDDVTLCAFERLGKAILELERERDENEAALDVWVGAFGELSASDVVQMVLNVKSERDAEADRADRMTREARAARAMMNSVTSGELSGYALDYFNEHNYDAWCAIRAENEKHEEGA